MSTDEIIMDVISEAENADIKGADSIPLYANHMQYEGKIPHGGYRVRKLLEKLPDNWKKIRFSPDRNNNPKGHEITIAVSPFDSEYLDVVDRRGQSSSWMKCLPDEIDSLRVFHMFYEGSHHIHVWTEEPLTRNPFMEYADEKLRLEEQQRREKLAEKKNK